MKKHLIAVAVAAAFSVPAVAQNVTLSGLLDVAGADVSGTQKISRGTTFSTSQGTSATSVIKITAVEDIGGGNKITAHYGLDPRGLVNDSLGVTNNTNGTVANVTQLGTTVTGLARDEAFVGIAGDFGNVRLGSPNSLGLEAHLAASPLGTGVGSGFAGTTGTMMNSIVQIRYNRSIRYDSPTVAGFSASVLYAPGNDRATETPGALTGGSSTALGIPNARKATELALKYAAGPFQANWTTVGQAEQAINKVGYYGGAYAAGAANAATTANIFVASYNFGNTTIYAGANTGDALAPYSSSNGSAVSAKGKRASIKHSMGAIDLAAQYTVLEYTGAAVDSRAKVTGLRADYNLSKSTAAYVGYDKWDTGIAYTTTLALTTGQRQIVSMGLRKSF